ncbi:MAG: response regulator [Eubacteriales bacterium]|nr:response regulator [Eubacteriales bacterium]
MIRVVLADDEPRVCDLISRLADWKSHDMELVGVAHNGIAAMELIQEHHPDLVISDIKMPGYDGLILLKKARELIPEIEFVIISGYRQFEYAQTAIQYGVCDYLLKPINRENLQETLHKIHIRHGRRTVVHSNEHKIRSTLLRDLMEQHTVFAQDIAALNEHYQFHFGLNDVLSLFVLKADALDTAELDAQLKEDISTGLKESTWTLLKKLVQPLCHDIEVQENGYFVWGLLGAPRQELRAIRMELLNTLKELRVEFSLFSRLRLSMAIAPPCDGVEQLAEASVAARRMLDQRLLDRHSVLFEQLPEEVNFPQQTMLAAFSTTMESLIEVIDMRSIGESLDAYAKELLAHKLAGYQLYDMALSGYHVICDAARRNLMQKKIGADAALVSGEEAFQILAEQCGSVERLITVFRQQALGVIAEYQALVSSNNTRPINMAKQYIQEHYQEHLSLDEISEYVGFNPSYFATLFRKETNQTVVEYITEVRIRQAREMLRTTRLTVQEICEAVGYRDGKHFLKTFKKDTGVSPNEYRKLYPR